MCTIYDAAMVAMERQGKSATDIIHIGTNDFYCTIEEFTRIFGDARNTPCDDELAYGFCKGLVIMFSDDSWLSFETFRMMDYLWTWEWEYQTKPQINPFATKITGVW